MKVIREDAVEALRSLVRAPGFTTVVVVTLALGIGANTAAFSLLDTVLLRPLPFPAADRVANLAWQAEGHVQTHLSGTKYQYWRERVRSLDAAATWQPFRATLGEGPGAVPVTALRVTPEFLTVLGFAPQVGRDFVAADASSSGALPVIVSDRVWNTSFARDPGVLGATQALDGRSHTIIGVLPDHFAFPYESESPDVLVPMEVEADPSDEAENWPTIVRIAANTSPAEVAQEVSQLSELFAADFPDQVEAGDRGMVLASFNELYTEDSARALWILMTAVACVLAIACANVATLFLARGETKRKDAALRSALGASRRRVARPIALEAVYVALAGGLLALPIADRSLSFLLWLSPDEIPRMSSVSLDPRVLGFSVLTALVTAVVFGMMAVKPLRHVGMAEVLKGSDRTDTQGVRGRQVLVAGQAALSTMLLMAAGLMVTSLANLGEVDLGFETSNVLAARFSSAPDDAVAFDGWFALPARLSEAGDMRVAVEAVATATSLPMERGVNVPVVVPGATAAGPISVEWRAVSAGYFETLGIPVRRGRPLQRSDDAGSVPAAVVNETFATTYFGTSDAVGQRVDIGQIRGEAIHPSLAGYGVEIVGVVGDVREVSLRVDPRPTIYVSGAQAPEWLLAVLGTTPRMLIRARSTPGSAAQTVRSTLAEVGPTVGAPEMFPLEAMVSDALVRERFGASLLSAFGLFAFGMTALGTYSVLAYSVRQRRREIGIRGALGADRRVIIRWVVMGGVLPVAVGMLAGIAGGLGLTTALDPYLWDVGPRDPKVITVSILLLLAGACCASWIPAREAARVNPREALT